MKKLIIIFVSLLLIINITAGCNGQPPTSLTVHFIDVGQGDSILIDIGDTEVLIDGGEKKDIAADYISDYVDGAIEAVIITHYDLDHIGGLISIFEQYDVKEFWYNGKEPVTDTSKELIVLVNSEDADIHTAERGDEIQIGVLIFSVLNPAKPLSSNSNHDSIILELSYGETDFLFMGDADNAAESEILNIVHDIDILKVGHHGSKYSSSQEFLSIVKPEVAIYMAGEDNKYKHPHQETIDALKAIHAEIYGTDKYGTIQVITDGISYDLLKER
jgi:competence protein ComEC